MKFDMLGSASAGFFAVASSWLVANGSSLPILIMALIGAVVAVLDLEDWTFRKVVSLLMFNTLVGAFGGPVLVTMVGLNLGDWPPAALLLLPFLLGWAGHYLLTELRATILSVLAKRAGGIVK